MSNQTEADLKRGYEQTGFEIVPAGKNLELPVSDAATYRADEKVLACDLEGALDDHNYAFIAPYAEGNWTFSSKLLDTETNEFLHIKLNGTAVRIFPKSEEFSFETFRRAVETIDENVAALTLEAQK